MSVTIVFLLVAARLLAVVFTAPVLGNRHVPVGIRVALGLTMALLILPLVGRAEHPIEQPSQILSALLNEVLTGGLMGLCITIIVSSAMMAGNLIGHLAGTQFAETPDGANAQLSTTVGHLTGVLGLAIFALIGGPELVLAAAMDTFVELPVGQSLASKDVATTLITILQQSFELAVKAFGPALAALLAATLVSGMIGRTYPQMNMLQFGLNSNLVVMLLAIFLTLGGFAWLFADQLLLAIQNLQTMAGTPINDIKNL
jgi:flagellar biosynthetic protein FliR